MFSIDGKGALVTGASGGIGAAIARALHGAGAAVALSGTRTDRLAALAGELGARAHVTPADLAVPGAAEELADAAAEALGSVDILINNAGLTRDNLALRMKDEEWESVLAVNLGAAFRLSRATLRAMMRKPLGPHRQHHFGRWHHRQSGSGQLRRVESRHHRHGEGAGPGGCQPRHHGQLHRPRSDRHGDDRVAE